MTHNELNEYALEVHAMPNSREKFRLMDLIEMARNGTPEALEQLAFITQERDDYRNQVADLEARLEARRSLGAS